MNQKIFNYTSSVLWIVTLIALVYGVYLTGVEHGRLQGLQCGTDTECEVLADMLNRH
jgi:hypothetical protein